MSGIKEGILEQNSNSENLQFQNFKILVRLSVFL